MIEKTMETNQRERRAFELLDRIEIQCNAVGHPVGGVGELRHIIAALTCGDTRASAPAVEAPRDVVEEICQVLCRHFDNLKKAERDGGGELWYGELERIVSSALQPSATQPDVVEADVLRVAKLAHLVHTDGKEKWEAADQYRWENTARWVISDINTHNAAMPNHIADTSKMVEARRNALMEARDAIGELKVDKAFKWDASCEIMRLIKLAEATTDGEKG